ncbi:Extracellular basic protease precursor [Kocuria rosea]|uniref:S8 family serine peptidase n=1 Tax=Kocuria rosea TaxID=1275 RepID=UPI000F6DB255|nr:S8 family serine peptidase [Kocuria rosea]VEH42431.1 Extracellular basic protease precursor [Kocuria rosea]
MQRSMLAPTLSALSLALVLAPLTPATAAPAENATTLSAQQVSAEAPPEITDRMIVKYRTPVTDAESEQVVEDAAAEAHVPEAEDTTEVRTTGDGAAVVELAGEVSTDQAEKLAEELTKDPAVAYAEPDRLVSTARIPGSDEAEPEDMGSVAATAADPDVPSLWALTNLRAFEAWDTATGKGVTVGVVDTGFANHPDLDSQTIGGYDFVSTAALGNDGNGRDSDPRDPGTYSTAGQCYAGSAATNSIWHGTHVAGTVAAKRDSYGTVGIAPDATLLNARALGACGFGYVSDMADAVRWLAGDAVAGAPAPRKRADVINMSLSMGGGCPATLQNAINTAWFRNIPVAVAAGNSGRPAIEYAPGNCYNVITVGAIGSDRVRASYSNHGGAVDIYAPGHHILSAGNTGTRGPVAPNSRFDYGTSMATPHVAGTLALLKQKNPTLSSDQYKQLILDSGDAWDSLPGGKTLNSHDALWITKPADTAAPAAPTPTYTTKGAIGSLYQRIKSQTGAPTSHEQAVAGGVRQSFAKGTIYWSSATGAYWVRGGVETAYKRNGTAAGVLRFPRSDEKSNGIGGAYQLFQNGRILWSSRTGAHALTGDIETVFAAAGNEKGALGYPTADRRSNGIGGFYQTFQKGRILWSSAHGAHPITGATSAAYSRAGSERGSLGYPTSGAVADGRGGTSQSFQKGRIVWSAAGGAHALKGSIGAQHNRSGGTAGALGYPTTDEASTGTGGVYQVFQKGRIYWSPRTYAQETKGSIGNAYVALGGTKSRLGFPRTGEITRADRSVVQYYQGGSITWRPGGSIRIDYR